MRTPFSRVIRDISRKTQGNDVLKDIFTGDLPKAFTPQKQQHHSKKTFS
jgi:hypothetical protein